MRCRRLGESARSGIDEEASKVSMAGCMGVWLIGMGERTDGVDGDDLSVRDKGDVLIVTNVD